jgi:hypothetical protein
MGEISSFIRRHYRHFNAATLVEAAESYRDLVESGGRMMVTLAGAMSTAELGRSLAEMIRQDKVHAITCTGANLEEDVFNLVAHRHYKRIPNWRNLRPEDERALAERGLNRVTDTCIPEAEAFRVIERHILELWQAADSGGERLFPHEFLYKLVTERLDGSDFQVHWAISSRRTSLVVTCQVTRLCVPDQSTWACWLITTCAAQWVSLLTSWSQSCRNTLPTIIPGWFRSSRRLAGSDFSRSVVV